MVENLGRPINVPADKRSKFKALTETPSFAIPTLVLAMTLVPAVLCLDVLVLLGRFPLVWAVIFNTIFYYFFFSVIHDGIHRGLCKNQKLNDWISQFTVTVFAPFAAVPLFRWAHMEHHRFTNDDRDPDSWSHGAWWTLPFRWMVIDLGYGLRALSTKTPLAKKAVKQTLPFMVTGFIAIFLACFAGYGLEVLMLWFIPSRLAFVGIGFSFFWLPHAHWPDQKVELRQSKNFTIATTIRLGKEWILNPILQYQNYHLIHHLWPTTPFYNNAKVWNLLEPELRQRDLAVVENFSLKPVYEYANQDLTGASNA
ncbi:MAG: hypothetical protein COA43_01025 [Robiginitomaculum sp.]|nr:MAG: hypothetical protein COA43_01025 [Robiginitomaculum sp.]